MQYVKKYWWVALLGLFWIPYLAFQNMEKRKGQEAALRNAAAEEVVHPLDGRVPSVALVLRGHDTYVRYQNNAESHTNGLGIAVLTWDDFQANPERLQKAGYQPDEQDFPVVVFFNQSGFDATGDPAVVRRVKDGTVAFEIKDKPRGLLRAAILQRSGDWSCYFWPPSKDPPTTVTADDFYRHYLGMEPPQPVKQFSQQELDKMTVEELQKHGIKRLSEEEYFKRVKTGIRGEVIKVGGRDQAVNKLAGVKVYALKGQVEPTAKLEDKDPRIAGIDKTDKDGKFTLPLSPGAYTLVVEQDGKFYGNSFKGERWPSVTVKDAWVDYEFRRGN